MKSPKEPKVACSNLKAVNALVRMAQRRFRPVLLLPALVAVAAFALAGTAEAATRYVSPLGADSPTCGAQGAPCENIDQAVKISASGDFIRIAGGTYTYVNVGNGCGSSVTSIVCIANKSLTIRGGYSPSTWAFDPVGNPTIIDGQNTYRGVYVFSSIAGIRVAMSNVTIQNGRSLAPPADGGSFGGGMSVDGATVTLTSMKFQNNQVIGPNIAASDGGSAAGSALSIRGTVGSGVSLVTGSTFTANSSVGGTGTARGGYAFGALFVFNAAVHVENSQFTNNTALGGSSSGTGRNAAGALADALGAGIAVETGGNISLSRVTSSSNTCTGGSGTTYGGGAYGAGMYVEGGSVSIADSRFQSNVVQAATRNPGFGGFAAGGGVMFFDATAGSIDRSVLIANRATGGGSSSGNAAGSAGGGGLYLWRGDASVPNPLLTVRNSVFAENLVQIGATGTNPGGGGGGVFVQGAQVQLEHLTMSDNRLGSNLVFGQAVGVVASGVASTVTLRYSAITGHVTPAGATAVVLNTSNTLSLVTPDFSGNTHNTNCDGTNNPVFPGTCTGLGTSLALAPSYVSPGTPNYNYHLQVGSALRNAATGSSATIDMDYERRSGVPDLGADEFVSTTCTPGGAPDSDLDGIPDTMEATEGTRACSRDNDIFTSERLFPMQQYRDFLKRESDADGLVYWMGLIGDGTARGTVTKSFFDSPEFQGAIAPIARLYFAYFNRIPDQPGFEYWVAQYGGGATLNDISQVFATSPEFISTYGSLSDGEFVTLVYNNVLGRAPDVGGYNYWVAQLSAGMPRGNMMVGFSESPEYQQTSYNRVFVTMMYYGMLKRMPEQAGFDYWVGQLNAGASPLDLINGVLGATEYHQRFLP